MIERNKIYVDKTKQIYRLLDYYNYTLTICPRRFGKTLFLSTIEAFYTLNLEWFLKYGPNLWITDHMKNNIDWNGKKVKLDELTLIDQKKVAKITFPMKKAAVINFDFIDANNS
jgi:hypothetical protein